MPNGLECALLSPSLSLPPSNVQWWVSRAAADGDRYVGNILKPLCRPPYFFFDSAVPKEKRSAHHSARNSMKEHSSWV